MSDVTLDDIRDCFTGVIPMVMATASASGVPNVTFLSRAHPVGDERIAISNQFMSKSKRNLAENPRASLMLIDPFTYDEYRLTVVFERTERRGPIFDKLRNDLCLIAALQGMQDVFRLQAADVFRIIDIEKLTLNDLPPPINQAAAGFQGTGIGELCARISRCSDLDTLVRVTVDGMAELLDYTHSSMMLLDENGERLFTIASHGYETEGIGSEVAIGEGVTGMAASQCAPIRVGNLRHMTKYARTVRNAFEESGEIGPGHSVPVPDLPDAGSKLAVPALALGQLVGVLTIESLENDCFTEHDAATLTVIATLVASSVETLRSEVQAAAPETTAATTSPVAASDAMCVRYFPEDGSTFIDGDYLIKGVAGRILWSLLNAYDKEGRVEFTNREVRLNSSLDLPDFRDNFESRLILLKRRLDERQTPVRIEKTGRGKFRLAVEKQVQLEQM